MKYETTCRNAWATLDALAPDEEAPAGLERQAAEAHIRSCAVCQQRWQHERDWDERLHAAMVDVPIPEGLQSRLQALVAPTTAPSVMEPARRGRVWRKTLLVAVALVMMVGGLWGLQTWRQPQFSMTDLDGVPAPAMLREFRGSFALRLPQSWQSSFRFAPNLARGYSAPRRLWSEPMAVIPFQFRTRRFPEPIQGHLLVVRRSNFRNPPPTGDFTTTSIIYSQRGPWIVWSEGELVYACTVYSGPAVLEHMRWLMSQSQSLS